MIDFVDKIMGRLSEMTGDIVRHDWPILLVGIVTVTLIVLIGLLASTP